jgi:hypothetical protein
LASDTLAVSNRRFSSGSNFNSRRFPWLRTFRREKPNDSRTLENKPDLPFAIAWAPTQNKMVDDLKENLVKKRRDSETLALREGETG